jgi:hypothetical protein
MSLENVQQIDSSSIRSLEVGTLIGDPGSNIDFSQATQVSGSFVGRFIGDISTAVTASYAKTASVVLMSGNIDGGTPDTTYNGILFGNIDGGTPTSVYGGVKISPIDGGGP